MLVIGDHALLSVQPPCLFKSLVQVYFNCFFYEVFQADICSKLRRQQWLTVMPLQHVTIFGPLK